MDKGMITDAEIKDRCLKLLDHKEDRPAREIAYSLISEFNLEKEDIKTKTQFLSRVLRIVSEIINDKAKGLFTEYG